MIERPPLPAAPTGATADDPAQAGGGGRASESRQNERMWGLVVLAALAFNPPLLRAFGAPAMVLGWPLLYIYIFAIWGGVIVLAARLVDRGSR